MAPSITLINDGNILQPPASKSISSTKGPRSESKVLHRSLHTDPLLVVKAEGNYLYLRNGQKIFDASGGAAVACLGHGDGRVLQAVTEQMSKVSYCHSLFYSTDAAEELSSLLIDSTEGDLARAFIVSSGSEAMEAALKLARQYHLEKSPPEPQRVHFVARQQSYHGTTLGALAVGGHVARRVLYEPMLSTTNSRVSPCFAYRSEETVFNPEVDYLRRLESELEAEFQRVGPENVAAFIAEPVVGAALGCVPPIPGYFSAVRRICDKYGALLILDEIMCGCGRAGPEPTDRYPKPLHAWQDPLVGVVPDLMTIGKGLGGGYMPVAALLANHKVIDVLRTGCGSFSYGQTYQGHPVACRAAAEVQKVIRDDDLVANVRRQGRLLGKLLQKEVGDHWAVGDIRGLGLLWGLEFVMDKYSKTPFEPSAGIAMAVHELAMQPPHNISIYPGSGTADGRNGDHVIIAPAYNVTSDDIQQIVRTVATIVQQFFGDSADGFALRVRNA